MLALPSLLRRAPTNPGGLSDRAILYIAAAAVALLVVSVVSCIVCCRRTRRAAPPAAEQDEALRAEVVQLRAEVAKLRAAQPSDRADNFAPPPSYDVKADGMV
jgi:hypothetical protein